MALNGEHEPDDMGEVEEELTEEERKILIDSIRSHKEIIETHEYFKKMSPGTSTGSKNMIEMIEKVLNENNVLSAVNLRIADKNISDFITVLSGQEKYEKNMTEEDKKINRAQMDFMFLTARLWVSLDQLFPH